MSRRVLIVDDSLTVRADLEDAFTTAGFRVTLAESLDIARRVLTRQPIDVIGDSAGGFFIGLAASAQRARRLFTTGAQYAYWRDYAPEARRAMFLRWHVAMPLLARLLGYVPAKRLGWMEDTPKGVALDWARMGPRFEATVRRGRETLEGGPEAAMLARRFGQVRAPILALGIEDDPFGTMPALDRLLDYYTGGERHHLRLAPAAIEQAEIGHFAFFHERFRDALWPLALDWLRTGEPPTPPPRRQLEARHDHEPPARRTGALEPIPLDSDPGRRPDHGSGPRCTARVGLVSAACDDGPRLVARNVRPSRWPCGT